MRKLFSHRRMIILGVPYVGVPKLKNYSVVRKLHELKLKNNHMKFMDSLYRINPQIPVIGSYRESGNNKFQGVNEKIDTIPIKLDTLWEDF